MKRWMNIAGLVATLALLSAVPAVLLATTTAAPTKDRPRVHSVTIGAGAFTPAAITIRAGDSVSWNNGDDRDHNVTAADGSFDSGNIRPGASFTQKFTQAGRFAYTCKLHPRTRGSVTVQ